MRIASSWLWTMGIASFRPTAFAVAQQMQHWLQALAL
jgi:hypothetical protein